MTGCNNRENGATDGTRTHDHSDHNRGLYQLSYSRHAVLSLIQRGGPGQDLSTKILKKIANSLWTSEFDHANVPRACQLCV